MERRRDSATAAQAINSNQAIVDWFDNVTPVSESTLQCPNSGIVDENARREQAAARRRAYLAVFILFSVNLLNYMDRYTVAGVLLDVQDFYGLNMKEAGLIQTAFICSYMVLAPIFGYLGDRYNRRYILTAGVFLWSVTTFLGSLVPPGGFGLFLLLRGLVGIGEASYSTIAPTIIADLFAKSRRSKMLAVFYFAIPVGSGLGYIVGSEVAKAFGHWQWALRITPILGLGCDALIFLFLEDPPRGLADGNDHMHATSWTTDLRHLISNRTFCYCTLAFTCVSFTVGSLAVFAPEFMTLAIALHHKVDSASVSLIFGIITCAAGLSGVSLGSVASQRLRPHSRRADPLICAVGILTAVPFLYLSLLLSGHHLPITWLSIFTTETLMCVTWPIVADIMLYVVAPTRRGTAAAFQILVSHAFGDAGSPYLIGVLTDIIIGSRPVNNFVMWQSLQYALYLTCFVTALGGFFFLRAALYVEHDRHNADVELHRAQSLANNVPPASNSNSTRRPFDADDGSSTSSDANL